MNTGNESDTYRLLIPRRNASELLLLAEGREVSLLSVEVPRGERVAPHITKAVKDRWGFEAVCLFSPGSTVFPSALSPVRYQVLESCQPNYTPHGACIWLPIESLSEASFADPEDLRRIRSAMGELESYANGSMPGAFGKPGWLREVLAWVDQEIAPLGLRTTGPFRQLNASPTFSLVRIETNGPALWFKAVGEPNVREFPISVLLANLFPDHTPRIIATRAGWNAWLTTEVDGKHPDRNSEIDVWIAVARTLADLQIGSFGKTLHFIDTGCHDTRVSCLAERIDPFLEVMTDIMQQQTKASPSPLSTSELWALGGQLREILLNLSQSSIPNALVHLDLNPDNILLSDTQCVFLDWSEASVGHPFVAFQYLLEHLRKLRRLNESWEAQLISAYTKSWRLLADPQTIAESINAAPLLAVFTCALAGETWRDESRRSRPEIAALLRSLTRRMKHEADRLCERGNYRTHLVEGRG